MKIIYNRFIPFKGFVAMLTLCILWVRSEYKGKVSERMLNHERIHSYQQMELMLLYMIVNSILSVFIPISWWLWLIMAFLFPFFLYVLCWLIELILPPYDRAYKDICFEAEARYNEDNPNYLKERGFFTFKFLKYISNSKYDK